MLLPVLLMSLLLSPANDDKGTCPPAAKNQPPDLSRRATPKSLTPEVHYVGTVVLQLDLSDTGAICDVKILKSAGAEPDNEALQVIRGSLFQPITVEGKPIPGSMLILRDYFRGNNSNTLVAENANAAEDAVPAAVPVRNAPLISAVLAAGQVNGSSYRNDYFGISFDTPGTTLTAPKPEGKATTDRLVTAMAETENRAQAYTLSLIADSIANHPALKSQTEYVGGLAAAASSQETIQTRAAFPVMISGVQFSATILKEQDSPNTHHYRGFFTTPRKGYWLTLEVTATTEERVMKIASSIRLTNP